MYEGAARSLSSNRAMTGCNNSERARRWRAGTCGLRNLWDPMSIMNFLQMGVHVVSDRRLLACLGQSLLTSSNGSARMRSTARQPRQIQRLTVIDHRWWLPWQSKGYADSAASCNWSCFSLFSTCCELSWLWLAVPHISQVFQFKTLEEECRMGQSSSKIWLEDREQFTSFDLSSHPQSCAKGLAVQKKEVLTWRASCRNVAFSFWLSMTQYASVALQDEDSIASWCSKDLQTRETRDTIQRQVKVCSTCSTLQVCGVESCRPLPRGLQPAKKDGRNPAKKTTWSKMCSAEFLERQFSPC